MTDLSARHPSAFRASLLAVSADEREDFVNAQLGFTELPDDARDLSPDVLLSFPSAVEEIVALVDALPLRAEHVFVDVGSGTGRAAILAHLLSGARTQGIELQAHLVEFARARAGALGLADVAFTHGDAAEMDLAGDVFFLYAPARGALLTRIVQRLERLSTRKPIAVCTVALDLRGCAWLRPRRTACETLTIYESVVDRAARG